MSLTLRSEKGSSLTYEEMDANFRGLANGAFISATSDVSFSGAIKENVYEITGTNVTLDPSNGTIQIHTLTGNTTYNESFQNGESITLFINDGASRTIDWSNTSVSWVNTATAPELDLNYYTIVVLSKVDDTFWGVFVGYEAV